MIPRGFGPSPVFVQVLQKSRTDCCRMLNTGALPKTWHYSIFLLTLRKIKQLNSVQYLHILAQCITDISSISVCQIYTSLYRNSVKHRRRGMLVFGTGAQLVLAWESPQPAPSLLSNRQTLFTCRVVPGCRRRKGPAHIKFLEAELLQSAFMWPSVAVVEA